MLFKHVFGPKYWFSIRFRQLATILEICRPANASYFCGSFPILSRFFRFPQRKLFSSAFAVFFRRKLKSRFLTTDFTVYIDSEKKNMAAPCRYVEFWLRNIWPMSSNLPNIHSCHIVNSWRHNWCIKWIRFYVYAIVSSPQRSTRISALQMHGSTNITLWSKVGWWEWNRLW